MISWDLHISFAREADLVPTLQMMRLRQKGSELSILKPGRGSSGFEPRAWANSGAGSLGFRGQRPGFIAPFWLLSREALSWKMPQPPHL